MKTYTTIDIANFPAGTVLGLDAAQAAARKHALKAIKPATEKARGTYEALAPVQFKRGETLQLETEPSKAMADEVVTAEEAARREKESADAKEGGGKPNRKVLEKLRADIEAELRPKLAAELLALLPVELRTQVQTVLDNPEKA